MREKMAVQLRTARGRADRFQHGADFHQLGRFFLDRGQGHVEARERGQSAVVVRVVRLALAPPVHCPVLGHRLSHPPARLSRLLSPQTPRRLAQVQRQSVGSKIRTRVLRLRHKGSVQEIKSEDPFLRKSTC